MNPAAQAIPHITPLVAALHHEPLAPLVSDGERYIATAEGLMLEFRRPWIHGRWLVSKPSRARLPYGRLEPFVHLLTGHIPEALLDRFMNEAGHWAPTEHAAWITWTQTTRHWSLRELTITERTPHRAVFRRPILAPNEHLVLDIRSHGDGPALFSQSDDQHGSDDIIISAVVGHCRSAERSVRCRILALGHVLPSHALINFEASHASA